MVFTTDKIKTQLKNYSNKNTKISREVKKGNLIKIKNGLYENSSNTEGYLLAGTIYGPSYLSFDFALSFYSLIPEKVTVYTSATFNKKKKKIYTNNFGTFLYRDVPNSVYPLGIMLIEDGEYSYQIATPEKALCDKLYTLPPVQNLNQLHNLLFDDLRIDIEEFKKLKLEDIEKIANLYHCTNVDLLYKYMRRDSND